MPCPNDMNQTLIVSMARSNFNFSSKLINCRWCCENDFRFQLNQTITFGCWHMHPVNFKCHKIHRNCLQDNQNKLISKLCNIVYIWGKHACNIVHVWVNRNKIIYECMVPRFEYYYMDRKSSQLCYSLLKIKNK